MSNSKTCIGILFGGASSEHNVSIKSAQTVISALKSEINSTLYEINYFYIDRKGRWWPSEVALQALKKGLGLEEEELPAQNLPNGFRYFPKTAQDIQIWFPILHGPNGEDGSIQGFFKLIRKPFVGSGILGSAIGMDKIAMKAAFNAAGLPQGAYETARIDQITNPISRTLLINKLEERLGYPCFIKPANLGSSVGITKAYNCKELEEGLKLACSFDERIVIEKHIKGRELECAVLGKKKMKTSVVGEIKHSSDWYDYNTKYSPGQSHTLIPAPLSKKISDKIRELTLIACEAVAAHSIARVDFFYDEQENKVLINEINTLPGFTNQSMYPMLWSASGINIEQLVFQLLETAKE